MLTRILIGFFIFMGTGVTAFDANDSEAATAEYDESFLQVDECFAGSIAGQEACVVDGVQKCVKELEDLLATKGFNVPSGAALSPDEYCNYLGADRADKHLNSVYQRIIKQGPRMPSGTGSEIEALRNAQRIWLQFSNQMCSEENIIGWHSGGSGWGAVLAECSMLLSIQQAGHLERFFSIDQ